MFAGEEPTESLFMKELKRRGMTPTSLLEKDESMIYADIEEKLSNQRERSIALNSEGLEVKTLFTLLFSYSLMLRTRHTWHAYLRTDNMLRITLFTCTLCVNDNYYDMK